nr:hypothetical protein [Tanacetum cinerariifolium]
SGPIFDTEPEQKSKESNNKLSKENDLLYADFKKSKAELKRRDSIEYASKMELECAKVRVQMMNMLNNKCRTSFAKPEYLKKAKQANPRLLYDLFVPQREKSSEQRFFSERSRISHINVQNEKKKESFQKQTTFLEKRMDESIPKIYKPTNNNLRTSSNTSRANQDNSLWINKNAGYESQRSGNVAGARETVGSSVVSPDVVDSEPIFDKEPEQKVQNDDYYDVFAIESQHPEQSKSVYKPYLIEQDARNVIIESADMHYDSEQIDQKMLILPKNVSCLLL